MDFERPNRDGRMFHYAHWFAKSCHPERRFLPRRTYVTGRQQLGCLAAPTAASQNGWTFVDFQIRKAAATDVPRLREIIEASVRGLQANDYSPAQVEGALQSVYGVDSQLIADGTYLVAEEVSDSEPVIVACGGWSKRKTLYGGDQYAAREDSLLDPLRDAAKVRAFFVHPNYARRGIGTLILEACEEAAAYAGFTRLEMGATLSGVEFYKAKGYLEVENQAVPLSNGETLPIVKMTKALA
jgi:GNAT superfamily N-acetyltransferase